MKKNHFLFTGLAIAISLGLPSSCKKPTDGVDLIISAAFSEATTSFQFVDAKTGEQLGFESTTNKVTVVMNADATDKGVIVNNASGNGLNTDGGFLTLALKKGVIPSESNPVNFNLVASAPGYLSNTIEVEITEAGSQHFVVKLVNLKDTPDGVSAVENSAISATSTGATNTELTLGTPTTSATGVETKTTLTIPAGTILKDKDNKPVTGTITSSIVYFNGLDESSAESFPGGNGLSGKDEEGNDIAFNSGGFANTEMRGNGKEVKNFGSSVGMRMEIPDGTTDAEGNLVMVGSEAPVWSYDDEKGTWKQEAMGVVTLNSTTGKMEVAFQMTHLSYWGINWKSSNMCKKGARINFISPYTSNYMVVATIKDSKGRTRASNTIDISNGSSYRMKKTAPKAAKISWYSNTGKKFEYSIANLCSGTYDINVVDPDFVTVTATVNATCADDPNTIIRPNVTVYGQLNGTTTWFYVGEMIDGKMSTSVLQKGKTYKVAVSFGGKRIVSKDSYTVEALSYSFNEILDPEICKLIN